MDNPWWKKNGATLAALVLIFGVALFLRAYFVYPAAFPTGAYSGGSDSFYWDRGLNYSFQTGHHLVRDCGLGYPACVVNPRPPMYPWFSLLMGWVISPLFGGDVWAAIKWMFLLSTALFGALTVLPLYGLVKEAFSRRAGLLAAFLLAVSPAHLQRSVASNADHDAFTLFFVVAGYYFFFRALRTMNERKWVESWRRPAAIRAGVLAFLRENREPVLYALLSAMCLTTIALAWQGWAYAPIILLVYLVVQLFVHRLRNVDPMGLTLLYILAVGPVLLLAFPWYFELGQVRVWFDVPAYLFAAVLALAFLLTVTRDYPWSVVIPSVIAVSAVGIAGAALANPVFANALVSGAGYFVSSKLYETIAEAQPPGLSQVILSFGWPLYFLSWAGIVYMVYQVATGRRLQTPYLFFVVWAFAAVFMAQAAARFIFNASPAFAATAAYMFILLIDRFDFAGLKRQFASLSGGRRLSAFRRSVKVRHVLGAFVIVVLLLPTTWYALDASIPFEAKHAYDEQIYSLAPGFLRPPGYSGLVGSRGSFYLGAFGFSLPQAKEAYPAAWRWLASQDTDVPLEQRPAYLSWWDYGFEALDVGKHPTVADNFQDGYHFAGNFLAAQNESESIALLSLRLLDGDFYRNGHARGFSPPVMDVLRRAGVDDADLLRAYLNPAGRVPVVQGDPDRYGRYDPAMQPQNALYIYATHLLTSSLPKEQLVQLYAALRSVTGWSIRYFAVDTRLFPQDASNTGIFYAPMKLSDRRIATVSDGRVIPTDFFRIIVTTGTGAKQLQDLSPTDRIVSQQIQYQPMFYHSMFYRAYVGYSPREVGSYANGIPGFPQSGQSGIADLQRMEPMQAWNLTHWRVVYKTAYYNPFTDAVNHTGDWQAISYEDALRYQKEIGAGTRQGRIDVSARSLISAGVVIVKYYDGAFVNGTVTIGGTPVPGVRITVQDELGIPHDLSITDAQGRYSVLVPFGNVSLVAWVGTPSATTQTGTSILSTTNLVITDDQAMRSPADRDGDGLPDWILTRNIVLPARTVSGVVFLDADHNGQRAATEPAAPGAVVTATSRTLGTTVTVTAGPTGGYFIDRLPTGAAKVQVSWGGRTLALPDLTVPAGNTVIDLAIPVTSLSGTARLGSGAPAAGATVLIRDEVNGSTVTLGAEASGAFLFPLGLRGNYTVAASLGELEAPPMRIAAAGSRVFANLTLLPSGTVTAFVWVGGNPQPFATLTFLAMSATATARSGVADANGYLTLRLPETTYSVTGRAYRVVGQSTELWVYLGTVNVAAGAATSFTANFVRGAEVRGQSYSGPATNVTKDVAVLFTSSAGRYVTRTGPADGRYVAYLPLGTYRVQAVRIDLVFLGTAVVSAPMQFDLPLEPARAYTGTVFRDLNANGALDAGEGIRDAQVTLSDPQGRELTEFADATGRFTAPLPAGGPFAMRVSRSGFADATFAPADLATLRLRGTVPLTPLNATVSGAARFSGAPPGALLTVHFAAKGAGARPLDVRLNPSGNYVASLVPGAYAVTVDENVTAGSNATRWQLISPATLDLAVGQPSSTLDLDLAQRHRVTGTVTRSGQPQNATVRFAGFDEVNATAVGGAFVVYLRPGAYSVSVTATTASRIFGFLGTSSVGGPASVAYAVVATSLVTGRILVAGSPLAEIVPLTIVRTQGGVLSTATEASGAFAAPLPPGDYAISVDHRSTALLGGASRFVRYTGSRTLSIPTGGSSILLDLPVARALDNVTMRGTVRDGPAGAPATLTFTARSGAAMNATATAAADGTFSLSLQPGTYGVYSIGATGGRVALVAATFAPRTDASLDLSLGLGVQVTGVTTYRGGTRVPATLVFSGLAIVSVDSRFDGQYAIVLPPGSYSVSAVTTTVENGLAVRYSVTSTLNVTGTPAPLNLDLQKEVRRSVVVTWDAAQRRTTQGGGQVTYTIMIQNNGNVAETFTPTGSPTSWFSFPQSTVRVDFGSAGNRVPVTVIVRPPADALVRHPALTVTATSRDDPSAHASATVEVDIVRVRTLGLTTASPVYDGRFLNLTAVIANRGNDAESVDLVIANTEELATLGWVGRFAQGNRTAPSLTRVVVPANGTVLIKVVFRPQGSPGARAILVTSAEDLRSLQASATASLSLPALAIDGAIGATGPFLSMETTVPYQLLAVLISAAAVIGVTAAVTVRRRRR